MDVLDPVILAAAAFCLLLHFILRSSLNQRGGSKSAALPLPPGPVGFPVLGALPFIGPAPHSSLARLARRYGPIMFLKMGTRNAVVASTAAAARAFLKNLDAQFANRPDLIMLKDITYGRQTFVFSDYSQRWKLTRKLLTVHLLSPRAVAGWAGVRRDEAGHVLRELHEKSRRGEKVTVPETMVRALANVVGKVVLGERVFAAEGEESNEFKDMIVELLTGGGMFNIGDFIPAIAWMDLQGVQAKMKRIHLKYDAIVTKMLERHAAKKHLREGNPDLVDFLYDNRSGYGESGETISHVNIKGIIFDLFTAGTDTSSIIVEWALAEMIKNSSILRRAQQEMDDVVGRGRRLEESDIPNLPYLQAIVKEALRMHPSTPLSIPHYSFDACEVEGYYVPANTQLFVNIWAIGRDPGVWEEPGRFDPERFLSGEGAGIDPMGTDFELIPFGAGRRVCVGKLAGLVFVQYFLGSLVHAFDWAVEDAEGMNMEETPGLALPKKVPVIATVVPRLAPCCYL